jgi:histone-lysine N-methyltransferase SETD1
MIHMGAEKQVRYDGLSVPGNPDHVSPSCTDPRKKPINSQWRVREELELPVPRMVIDEWYVGEPPKLEVTMDNLNDNINLEFLSNKLHKFGEWGLLEIDYHPGEAGRVGLGPDPEPCSHQEAPWAGEGAL